MRHLLLALVLSGFGTSRLSADIQLPSVFGDHMVLQQGVPLPVWGTAAPGEKIEVAFAGKKAMATADAQGRWKTTLDAVTGSTQPGEFVVTGRNRLAFADVLVGEVWVCAGQSNMVLSGKNLVSSEVEEKKQIRFFVTPATGNLHPQETTGGKWTVCRNGDWPAVAYSAVGYHFAAAIQQDRNAPVGMIESAVSGTAIEPWEELTSLEQSGTFRKLAEAVSAQRAKLPELTAKYEKEILPVWEEQHRLWLARKSAVPPAATAPANPAETPDKAGQASADAEPKRPVPPGQTAGGASTLFNGMVNPHIPYAIKGVLWYQGESNAQNDARATEYAQLLPLLISGWRTRWNQGNYPFLFVQLPAFTVDRPWATLRNSQFKTLSVPNTGMAVALDLNPTDNLHPPRKEEVGRRLSLLARKLAYDESVVASGPLYRAMKVEGNRIRLSFTETGGGLASGGPPPAYRKPGEAPAAGQDLVGFKVCAADGNWVPARAEIAGDTVLIWSDSVAQPRNASYAWDAYPKANLYNKEGLPASPFRTDDAPDFAKRE